VTQRATRPTRLASRDRRAPREPRLAPEQEADLADELAQHLEDRFRELRIRGATEAEARRVVLEELTEGNLAATLRGVVKREPCRGARDTGTREHRRTTATGHPLRHAHDAADTGVHRGRRPHAGVRHRRRDDDIQRRERVLLRPLPYRDPDQLVVFYGTSPENSWPRSVSGGPIRSSSRQSRAFTSMAAFEAGAGFTITGTGDPVRIDAATVSLDFFRVIGTPPLLGRTFVAGEDKPG
jgi:hypothetical protein